MARVTGATISQVGLWIVGAAHPRAAPPVFHRSPGQVALGVPEMPLSLPFKRAHMTFDGGAHPDQLAGLRVERGDAPDDAEFTAGHPVRPYLRR